MIRKLMPCIRSALAGLILSVFSLAVWAGEICPPESAAATGTPGATEALPKMVVHKTPYCGCCEQWVEHMKHAGFDVEVREVENLAPIKEALGVPAGTGSCHTAEVGGYFVEGHVPAEDIKRLLAEQRSARGLATPGMPPGSPGMPAPAGQEQPYEVLLIGADGSATVYARHGD
jgi:hypothetical protein